MPRPRSAPSLANVVDLRNARDAGAGADLFPVTVRDLTYQVGGAVLIKGIDLTLEAGGVTVIMGPNGAGKSILLRLMHGLIEPSGGAIAWGGRALDAAVRRRQAMVFQRAVLLRRSVAANIDFVLRLRGRADPARRREILEHAGLAAHADQPARLLSGGEQQRLALARALATDPDVLFMDEPTANLDPASTLHIEDITKAARDRGTKIILVTHDVGQARRLADDVAFVHRGKLLEHTPAARFFTQPASAEAGDYMAGKIIL
ncbi:MAG: ABC transporter ATP-binding protein [Rhodospirillales bacterium CG15_BIG_FIL_POST_REV_8_21_14_020_66_15]|nr:MAG: ABC transporter ATP-binding protein [Rhodospirillales bacterium CG15_BIG_FIL_POST_REV_8_21_14_020_66_15]